MWEWVEEVVVVDGEGEEERLCLWREVWSGSCVVGRFKMPFVEATEAIEFDIVAGPETVGWRGAVSSTFWRRGWRSLWPVVCERLTPQGL
jgi:hypothetical protein